MTSSRDAIKRVIEAFERSEWSEIDVRSGTVRVHLATSAPVTEHRASDAPRVPDGHEVSDTTRVSEITGEQPSACDQPPPAGAHLVVSPSPGIFWRSPEPGSPPFADVGATVAASATMCIVEVMKLMNHVKAGVGGEVVAVYCENGVAVQKGQLLFAIAPSGSSS